MQVGEPCAEYVRANDGVFEGDMVPATEYCAPNKRDQPRLAPLYRGVLAEAAPMMFRA